MNRRFTIGFVCYVLFAAWLCLVAFTAHAKIIAEAQIEEGVYVVFHDTPGPCLGDAKLVEYIGKNGDKVPGCWTARGDKLMCVFLDGDVGAIPMSALKDPKQV